ncbi:MAG: choice-of-anchor J domain-containing protein [Hyphomicrobiales bacterium]
MRKLSTFVFTLFLLLGLNTTNAQTPNREEAPALEEGFNSWPLTGWTILKNGDDTSPSWVANPTLAYEGDACAFHDFRDEKNDIDAQDYLISPEIDVTPSLKLSFYEMNKDIGQYTYGKHAVYISENGKDPEDFVLLQEFKDKASEWTNRIIDLSSYAGKKIHIAFYYEGEFKARWYIDAVKVYKPVTKDAKVLQLIYPTKKYNTKDIVSIVKENEDVVFSAKVANIGIEDIKDANVNLIIGDKTLTKKTDIPSFGEATVQFDAWTAVKGAQKIQLNVDIEGDENLDNNSMNAAIDVFTEEENITAYAYNIDAWDGSPEDRGPVRFNIFKPQELTELEHGMEDLITPTAGTMINNLWYCNFTYKVDPMGDMIFPESFAIINIDNGEKLLCDTATTFFKEMAYDYSTNTLFAVSGNKLYTIDTKTSESTEVASTDNGEFFLTFAINLEGEGYAIMTDRKLYKINLETAKATLVGAVNGPFGNYNMTMAFDHKSGLLFMASQSMSIGTHILQINTTTGQSFRVDEIKTISTLKALGFTHGEDTKSLTVNVLKDGSTIKDAVITIGETEKKTSIDGQVTFFPFKEGEKLNVKCVYTEETEEDNDGDDDENTRSEQQTQEVTINGYTELTFLLTGTEEFKAAGINLYPNPTTRIIHIEGISNAQMKLVDLSGRILKSINVDNNNYSLDLSDLDAGVYFLQTNSNGKLLSSKIVVRK